MIINRIITPLVLAILGFGILVHDALQRAGFMSSTSRVLRRVRMGHIGSPARMR